MKVLSWLAISLDGYIAREDGDEEWLPEEGWTEFVDVAKRLDNIVIGRETFELVMKLYSDYNFDSVDVSHKLIVTTNPSFSAPRDYKVVHNINEAVQYLEDKGVEQLFVVGGGKLNTAFLKADKVDEFWVTVSPYLLGKGRRFVTDDNELDIKLKLNEVEKLSKGRVQLKYQVIHKKE